MRRQILALVAALASATASRADEPRKTPAVVTSNKRDNEVQQQFNNVAVAVTIEDKGIKISLSKTAGICRYGGYIPRYQPIKDNAITLEDIGESFSCTVPHISTTYTLYRVGEDTVTFFYQQETDFSSWGKNLITIDRGTFTMPAKKKSNVEGSAAPERAAGPRLNKPVSSED